MPLLLLRTPDPAEIPSRRRCVTDIPAIQADVARTYHPDVWIVSDRYPVSPLATDDGRIVPAGDPRHNAAIRTALRATLTRLTAGGAQVVIVGPPPPGPPVECAIDKPPSASCGDRRFSTADPTTANLNRLLRTGAAAFPGKVAYLSVADILCPGDGRCRPAVEGGLARYDGIHYTATFSRRIVPTIVARAQRAGISFAHRER